jgi:hypothetical protein
MKNLNKISIAVILGLIITGCGKEKAKTDSSGQALVDPAVSEPLQYINLSGKGYSSFNDISYAESYAIQLNLSNNRFTSYAGIDKMYDGIEVILMDNNETKISVGGFKSLDNLRLISGNSFSGGLCELSSLSKLEGVELVNYGTNGDQLQYNDISCVRNFENLTSISLAGANVENGTSIDFMNNSGIKSVNFYMLPFSGVTYDTLDNGNMEYIDLSGSTSSGLVSLASLNNSSDTLRVLNAKDIRFSDIGNLANLEKLELLSVTLKEDYMQDFDGDWYAPANDYSSLFQGMTNLAYLDLSNSSNHNLPSMITDLTSLEGKPLVNLNLENTFMRINYFETDALASLTEMINLNLSTTSIEDTSFLNGLTKLQYLFLDNTYFNGNYEFLRNMDDLREVDISINDSNVAGDFDTSILENKPELEKVEIFVADSTPNRSIFNLDWVSSAEKLKSLNIGYLVNESNISKIYGVEFEYLNISTSNITNFNVLNNLTITKGSTRGEIVLPNGAEYNDFGYAGGVIRASYNDEFCNSWSRGEIKVSSPDPIDAYCF